jgi:hypothetical protein
LEEIDGSFGFECATCGQYHVGMPTFGWDWPIQYLDVPETERAARVDLAPDYCVIDDEWFFVRGCLDIPVLDHDEPFSWGAWVSLSRDNFHRYAELHDDVAREPGARFVGWLCSAFPGYPEPGEEPLKAALHIRPWPTRPFIELEPTNYPLAVEQREGITAERVREIAERLLHPPPPRGPDALAPAG